MGASASRFTGRRVLVTGGGTGIGRAVALAFAAEGARVVVAARRRDRLEEVVATAAPGAVVALEVDLRGADASRRMVQETIERLGGLDVLVNNAGVSYTEPFLSATEER